MCDVARLAWRGKGDKGPLTRGLVHHKIE